MYHTLPPPRMMGYEYHGNRQIPGHPAHRLHQLSGNQPGQSPTGLIQDQHRRQSRQPFGDETDLCLQEGAVRRLRPQCIMVGGVILCVCPECRVNGSVNAPGQFSFLTVETKYPVHMTVYGLSKQLIDGILKNQSGTAARH